jgi:16S rRNA U516 pseudouridylate synthase RsuA-like enzyme
MALSTGLLFLTNAGDFSHSFNGGLDILGGI